MVAYYVICVVVYFLFGYFFLSDEICGTGWYFLGALLFPIILFVLFRFIGIILERKGIIESPASLHQTGPSGDSHSKDVVPSSNTTVPIGIEPQNAECLPTPHRPTQDEMLSAADCLDGPRFEKWCAQLFVLLGFFSVGLTKTSGDQGVDIAAIKDDVRYAIQCKCYSSDIGNHSVQEVYAGKSMYVCHVGVVVTNRYFTPSAKELAKVTGILNYGIEISLNP